VKRTRPRALRPGDRVGVCATSSAVDADGLERGVTALRALGLEVVMGAAVKAVHHFTAGTVEDRLRDLQSFWDDDSIAGIFGARGGGGGCWVASRLDGAAMAGRPKVLVGYSDLTFLHSLLNRHGLVTFHGPMVARHDFAEGLVDEQSLRAAVFGQGGPYATAPDDMVALRPGTAEGTLQGGCISILASGAGTPLAMQPDPEGTIVFLEDLDERPYRIDRHLFRLRAAGAFEGARGIVFGDMQGCNPPMAADYTLTDVILESLAGLDVPIAFGLSSGHTANKNVTLPFGARARLTCGDEARLEILEASVL
jgi:muramoyltetrapeptide carboxypeptidase